MRSAIPSRGVSHTPDSGQTHRATSLKLRRAMREFEEASPEIPLATMPEIRMNMGTLAPVLTFLVDGQQYHLPLDRPFIKKLKRDFEFLDDLRRVSLEGIKRNPL